MANKRMLKKGIATVCGDLAGICLFSEAAENLSGSEISEIIFTLAELQETSINKVSISFDRTLREFPNKKEYRKAKSNYYKSAYSTIIEQLNTELQEILKRVNAAASSEK